MPEPAALYGVLAEFDSAKSLLDAVDRCTAGGYRAIEAYSPFSVEGLAEKLGFRKNRVPLVTLVGGVVGAVGGYFLQWYSAVIDYPINSGGRPLHSWPSFIPPTFELAVLGAALAAFFGLLVMNGLPRLNHPMFDAPDFDLASRSRFFLCVRSTDAKFDARAVEQFLRGLDAVRVAEVTAS